LIGVEGTLAREVRGSNPLFIPMSKREILALPTWQYVNILNKPCKVQKKAYHKKMRQLDVEADIASIMKCLRSKADA
jgi:hypothetical protein